MSMQLVLLMATAALMALTAGVLAGVARKAARWQPVSDDDKLARHAVLDKSVYSSEVQPDGTVRHKMEARMIGTPPEYAAVYRRRGMEPPLSSSRFDPAALWPYVPRAPHERHAMANGYFWLPCPLCGRYFGGHEIRDSLHLPGDDPGIRSGICPVCTAERNGGEV